MTLIITCPNEAIEEGVRVAHAFIESKNEFKLYSAGEDFDRTWIARQTATGVSVRLDSGVSQ